MYVGAFKMYRTHLVWAVCLFSEPKVSNSPSEINHDAEHDGEACHSSVLWPWFSKTNKISRGITERFSTSQTGDHTREQLETWVNNEEGDKRQIARQDEKWWFGRDRAKQVYTEKKLWDRLDRRRTSWKQQAQHWCLPELGQLSASSCFFSTACYQCSPPLFGPCWGRCSARPCDERGEPCETFNASSLTHALYSIMSEHISIVPAWIILFHWQLCWPCNLSAAALSLAQLDLIQQHLQDYIWQRSIALFPNIT